MNQFSHHFCKGVKDALLSGLKNYRITIGGNLCEISLQVLNEDLNCHQWTSHHIGLMTYVPEGPAKSQFPCRPKHNDYFCVIMYTICILKPLLQEPMQRSE